MPETERETSRKTLSVAIISHNEEANLARTLASIAWADEIVVVDSGSTDRTPGIAREFGVRFFEEPWRGFAAQKNFALSLCAGDWVLSLDADEVVSECLAQEIQNLLCRQAPDRMPDRAVAGEPVVDGYRLRRRNLFLGRWMRHGGYYPDPKLRLFRRGAGEFTARAVHETVRLSGHWDDLAGDLVHHAYPSLAAYIAHMDRYSTLAAENVVAAGRGPSVPRFLVNVCVNPLFTFLYNYFLRLGLLDGREGLLLHLYHSVYVSWKYAKAWEHSRRL